MTEALTLGDQQAAMGAAASANPGERPLKKETPTFVHIQPTTDQGPMQTPLKPLAPYLQGLSLQPPQVDNP